MRVNSFYPVLLTNDVAAGSRFFVEHLGFRETFRSDWYVSLAHVDRPEYEVAFLLGSHESIPDPIRGAVTTMLLNFEVEDATEAYERLQEAGVEILLLLRDEPWGQRHFIARAPGDVYLDVIQVIPAAPEFTTQYVA